MPSVILVDDEIWALRDLESLLSPYPHYHILASFTDSRAALDAIMSMQPDIVFTDLSMAELDGRELINELHMHLPQTAIVIVSAYRDFAVAREALNRNVIDYLLKPLSPEGVAALISRIDAEFAKAPPPAPSPAETFAAQLRDAAVYTCCCVVSFPDDARPDALLRNLYSRLSGNCSLIWSAEPGASDRILLVSAPSAMMDDVLSHMPASAGVSRMYADFSDFATMKSEAVVSRIGSFRFAANAKVAEIQSYLAAHYAEDVNLDNLAKIFFLSKNYLCDIFRSVTGTTVMSFLIESRLAVAAHLLRTSDRSIREIADSVGYADSAYFSRAFKKLYGMSPESWRREGK